MAFSPFKKVKNQITDDLFLEITWDDGGSPEDDRELRELIEGLDQEYLDQFSQPIEQSLPYLTFFQTELLFQAIAQTYNQFQVKKLSVAHLEGREVVTDGEVFISPLVIDSNYQNILLPLIHSILNHSDFKDYSYQEKREYFENQVYPVYRNSLGISDSSLPLFPVEGEEVEINSPPPVEATRKKGATQKPQVSFKKIYIMNGILSTVTFISLTLSFLAINQLSQVNTQLNYLYQEVKELESFKTNENQVDVFSRYFLPAYYSGNKELLSQFLSDGNAKYTVPESGALQSVILESLVFNPETKEYTVTYVLSVKKAEEPSNIRLSFSVKEMKKSKYGFVVTTEPQESNYVK